VEKGDASSTSYNAYCKASVTKAMCCWPVITQVGQHKRTENPEICKIPHKTMLNKGIVTNLLGNMDILINSTDITIPI
jgi:hypothetical protein